MIPKNFLNFTRFKSVVSSLPESEFLKNVLSLISGNLISQIILFASAPILTRLYSPSDFGVFALFSAIIGTVSKISSLCYERAILLPKEQEDADNIFLMSVGIAVAVSISVLILAIIYRVFGYKLFANIDAYLYCIPLGIFLFGLINNFRFYRQRKKMYKTLAFATVFDAIISNVFKIVIAITVGSFVGGLIGGFILGMCSSVLILFFGANKIDFVKIKKNISIRKMTECAKTYKQFPLFASWNIGFNVLSQNLVVFILTAFFSPAIVGFYNLGNRMLNQPILLISQAVQNVYFQSSAEDYNAAKKMKKDFCIKTCIIAAIGVIPLILFWIWGEKIITIIFGENWRPSGSYMKILAPWFFFQFISRPANVIYEVFQKQQLKLYISISKFIFRSLSLIIGYYLSEDVIICLICYSVVNILIEIISIYGAYFIINKYAPQN